MPLADDGDIIRGVGFVAIYSAYLEECVDDVLVALREVGTQFEDGIDRAQTSRKIRACRKAIGPLTAINEEMAVLDAGLDETLTLLERRNDVIHGRIYSQYGGPEIRKSGRLGVPVLRKSCMTWPTMPLQLTIPCLRARCFPFAVHFPSAKLPRPNPAFNTDAPWAALRAGQRVAG